MASTTYLSRFIYKSHSEGSSGTSAEYNYAGTYNLMLRAKSMPAPVSPPNNVESTTYEDDK